MILHPLVVTAFAALALAAPPPRRPGEPKCSVEDGRGKRWDLHQLMRRTGEDYEVKDEATGDVFKINVCRSVLTETWGIEDASKVGIYRVQIGQKGESLGSWNESITITTPTSLTMLYGLGSPCPFNPSEPISSLISFICSPSTYGTGTPFYAGRTPSGCAYFFTWPTPHACPSSASRGFWSGLFHLLFAVVGVVLVYLGLAAAYRRLILGMRGIDQVPPLSETWENARDAATAGVIWAIDRAADAGKVFSGVTSRDRVGGSGGGAWAQEIGFWDRERHDREQGSPLQGGYRGEVPNVVVTPEHDSSPSSAAREGAFVLGEDEERREEARAMRVKRFNSESPSRAEDTSATVATGRPLEGAKLADT